MNPKKPKLCRLCLKIVEENDYEVIENIAIEMMEVLLMEINVRGTLGSLLCTSCFKTLKKLFFFKSNCLDMEECINNYIRSKKILKIDLWEVYRSQNKTALTESTYLSQTVCRFCLNLFDIGTVNDIKKDGHLTDILKKYYPELDLDTTDTMSACESCLDSLIHQFKFATNCLETEKTVNAYRKMVAKDDNDPVDLEKVLEFVSQNNQETLALSVKSDTVEGSCADEIKDEDTETCDRNQNVSTHHQPPLFFDDIKLEIKLEKLQPLEVYNATQRSSLPHVSSPPRKEEPTFHCDQCSFTTTREYILKRHSRKHDTFKCDVSQSKSSKPKSSKHSLDQKTRSEKKIFRCEKCSFTSRYRRSASRHGLTHKDFSELTTFKCELCSFRTKRKYALKMHGLIHRSREEVKLHRCKLCPYGARLRGNLVKHMVKHKSVEAAKMYLCDICGFETQYKPSLETHLIKHKSGTEARTFKCDQCPFVAKYKGNLKKHTLVHMNTWEVTMHKCELCPFQTKHKVSLKTHMLLHKPEEELTLFGCDLCDFATKHKGNLKLHLLTHKDGVEAVMYKCEECSFETKHKMSLKTHMLQHRDISDVQMQKCETCGFQTLHKGNLKKHMLRHKNPSQIEMYQCEMCPFRTKHKASLKTHMAGHPA